MTNVTRKSVVARERASDAKVAIRTKTKLHIPDIAPARRYERPLVNIRTLISTGVVVAALVLAGPAASYAAISPEPAPTKPAAMTTQLPPTGLTASIFSGRSQWKAAVDTTDTAVLNQLHELEGKQSPAEIAKISASSPAAVLLDAATGTPLAAVRTAVKISPLLH